MEITSQQPYDHWKEVAHILFVLIAFLLCFTSIIISMSIGLLHKYNTVCIENAILSRAIEVTVDTISEQLDKKERNLTNEQNTDSA